MSVDHQTRSKSHQVITSEIEPLNRALDMNSGEEESPNNEKRGMGNPDLYPGFGRLLPPTSIARSSKGFEGIRAEQLPQEGEQHLIPSLLQNIPSTRKRRRASNGSTQSDTKDQSKHHREKSYVHHEYHDYSGLSGGPVVLPPLPKKGRGGVSSMFPTVLHHMLDDAEKLGFAHIVSWQSHGRCFIVHQPELFVKEVMTKYFRHTRLSSFQRQLSLYGFVRLARKGPDRGGYYHECFLRGMMHLCSNMQRTRVKGTQVRQSSSPESEPDFSALPPVGVDRDLTNTYSNTMMIKNLGQQIERSDASAKNSRAEKTPAPSNYMPPFPTATAQLPKLETPPDLTFGLPIMGDDSVKADLEKHTNKDQQDSVAAGRPRSTKFMRHLLARDRTREDADEKEELIEKGGTENGQDQDKSPDVGDGSPSSGESNKAPSSGDSKTRKVDADLAVFLEEVDLESDEDEALESEEAMARILEQDIIQISEV